MRGLLKSVLFVAGCTLAFNAFAETVIDEVWKCKLNEGKEIEDVHKANAAWVKHVNEALDAGEIKSGTVQTIVGEQDYYYFVDSYPNIAAWSTAKAYFDSEDGKAASKAVSDALDAAGDCKSNELYKYTSN